MSSPALTTHWQWLDRNSVLERQRRKLDRYLRACVLPFPGYGQRRFEMLGWSAHDFHSATIFLADTVATKEPKEKR